MTPAAVYRVVLVTYSNGQTVESCEHTEARYRALYGPPANVTLTTLDRTCETNHNHSEAKR